MRMALIASAAVIALFTSVAGAGGVSADLVQRLRSGGVVLSGWFEPPPDGVALEAHLATFISAADAELIASHGFGHVRLPVEWTILADPDQPTALRAGPLAQLDGAIDLFTAHDLAVIVTPAGSYDTALADARLRTNAIAFAGALAGHLAAHDPALVLVQVSDRPPIDDPVAWAAVRDELLLAMRAAAPLHTLVTATPMPAIDDGINAPPATWTSGTPETFTALAPALIENVVEALHFDEPPIFTGQGETNGPAWAALVHEVPYPASATNVAPIAEALAGEITDPAFSWIPDAIIDYGAVAWNRAVVEARLAPVVAWAQKHDAVVLIDAFGAMRGSPGSGPPSVSRHNWLRDVRRTAEGAGFGWTVDSYAGERGIAVGEPGRRAGDVGALAALGVDLAPAMPQAIDRALYRDALRGMWLATCIANWTGLRTEGAKTAPPFFTDEAWGQPLGGVPLDFVFQDPWGADDDTDIEYVYLHLLNHHETSFLSSAQITAGWILHINEYIWVSNKRARDLMALGTFPPATGMGGANQHWLMIDAQLTTEMFGAVAPGMPAMALDMALLPMLTTSGGHATLASQYHAVLYALAARAPAGLTGRDLVTWIAEEARRYVPDGSKTADIVDFVLASFLANPDPDDWESTRDAYHDRYQANAAANGFVYRAWYESSINFASSILALLYGEGDLKRSIQVGTLSGWDSDNPTATVGGLLGLLQGIDGVHEAFPAQALSDRYWIDRTRDAMPDYLPDDPAAEDTFTMLADRMLAIVDRAVIDGGGAIDSESGAWLPPPLPIEPLESNPAWRLDQSSAVRRVQRAGGAVTATSSVTGQTPGLNHQPSQFANGFEHDFDGVEPPAGAQVAYASDAPGPGPGVVILTVRFDRPVEIDTLRFVEGDILGQQGGWFTSLEIQVESGGVFTTEWASGADGLEPTTPFERIDVSLVAPRWVTAIRVIGPPGGNQEFVTCMELDGFGNGVGAPLCAGDVNADGVVDGGDLGLLLAQWGVSGDVIADLDRNGTIDGADLGMLIANWNCCADC